MDARKRTLVLGSGGFCLICHFCQRNQPQPVAEIECAQTERASQMRQVLVVVSLDARVGGARGTQRVRASHPRLLTKYSEGRPLPLVLRKTAPDPNHPSVIAA